MATYFTPTGGATNDGEPQGTDEAGSESGARLSLLEGREGSQQALGDNDRPGGMLSALARDHIERSFDMMGKIVSICDELGLPTVSGTEEFATFLEQIDKSTSVLRADVLFKRAETRALKPVWGMTAEARATLVFTDDEVEELATLRDDLFALTDAWEGVLRCHDLLSDHLPPQPRIEVREDVPDIGYPVHWVFDDAEADFTTPSRSAMQFWLKLKDRDDGPVRVMIIEALDDTTGVADLANVTWAIGLQSIQRQERERFEKDAMEPTWTFDDYGDGPPDYAPIE